MVIWVIATLRVVIMNDAAFVQASVFSYLQYIPRKLISGSHDNSVSLLRTCRAVFQSKSMSFHILINSVWGVRSFCVVICYCLFLWFLPSSMCEMVSQCGFDLHALFHALNLNWRSSSHMVIYMFQCCSLKSSHPHLLPQSPKVCSFHLCFFCCLAYRVVITIFLNSIYMH